MNLSETKSLAKPFSHIYVEDDALNYPLSKEILGRLKGSHIIKIKHYKDIFNRAGQDFLLQKENAVLLEYRHLGEAEESCLCKDPETVAAFLNALTEITVTGETSLVSSDDSDLFLFTDADGETYSFSFNSHHFEHGRTQYELSGDAALWRLADDLRTQDKTVEGR